MPVTPKRTEIIVGEPNRFDVNDARRVMRRLGVRSDLFGPEVLARGMNVEYEHRGLTHGDPMMTARIALDHLRERPDYYDVLERAEQAPTDAAAMLVQKARATGARARRIDERIEASPGRDGESVIFERFGSRYKVLVLLGQQELFRHESHNRPASERLFLESIKALR